MTLIPPLWKSLDNWLLVHYPRVWSTSFHWVFLGATLAVIVAAVIGHALRPIPVNSEVLSKAEQIVRGIQGRYSSGNLEKFITDTQKCALLPNLSSEDLDAKNICELRILENLITNSYENKNLFPRSHIEGCTGDEASVESCAAGIIAAGRQFKYPVIDLTPLYECMSRFEDLEGCAVLAIRWLDGNTSPFGHSILFARCLKFGTERKLCINRVSERIANRSGRTVQHSVPEMAKCITNGTQVDDSCILRMLQNGPEQLGVPAFKECFSQFDDLEVCSEIFQVRWGAGTIFGLADVSRLWASPEDKCEDLVDYSIPTSCSAAFFSMMADFSKAPLAAKLIKDWVEYFESLKLQVTSWTMEPVEKNTFDMMHLGLLVTGLISLCWCYLQVRQRHSGPDSWSKDVCILALYALCITLINTPPIVFYFFNFYFPGYVDPTIFKLDFVANLTGIFGAVLITTWLLRRVHWNVVLGSASSLIGVIIISSLIIELCEENIGFINYVGRELMTVMTFVLLFSICTGVFVGRTYFRRTERRIALFFGAMVLMVTPAVVWWLVLAERDFFLNLVKICFNETRQEILSNRDLKSIAMPWVILIGSLFPFICVALSQPVFNRCRAKPS